MVGLEPVKEVLTKYLADTQCFYIFVGGKEESYTSGFCNIRAQGEVFLFIQKAEELDLR